MLIDTDGGFRLLRIGLLRLDARSGHLFAKLAVEHLVGQDSMVIGIK